jgi:hypothetical protein
MLSKQKYEFWEPQILGPKFNLAKALNLPDRVEMNTPFHITAMNKDHTFFENMLDRVMDDLVKIAEEKKKFEEMDETERSAMFTDLTRKLMKLIDAPNNRGWAAFDLAPKAILSDSNAGGSFDRRRDEYLELEKMNIIGGYKLSEVAISADMIFKFNNPYQYMLITQADNSQVERTSVFIQLSRIT